MGKSHHARLPGPATSPGAYSMKPVRHANTSASMSTVGSGSLNKATVKSRPWVNEGYPEFSKLMASDDDLFVFRRFATVNARVILWMQYQIAQKEARLDELDEHVRKASEADDGRNNSFTWDTQHFPERDALMRELSALVLHYNNYVEAFSHMRARPAAEPRQIDNVKNWLLNKAGDYRHAIAEPEARSYIEQKYAPDLISISSRVRTPLGQWLESFTKLHVSSWFQEEHIEGKHVEAPTTKYSSNAKFEKLTNRSIIFGGLAMLLIPLWLLDHYTDSKVRLGIITAFMVAFMCIMSTATINRPFEVVASTAAYAAVLMVFMQIQPS